MKGVVGRVWLDGRFRRGWLCWERGRIRAFGSGDPPRRSGVAWESLDGARLVPGFVDTLLHGFAGIDCCTGSPPELARMTERLARSGVTTALAGFYPLELPGLRRAARRWSAWKKLRGAPRTRVTGWHVEGPFLDPAMRGALPRAGIVAPTRSAAARFVDACGGWLAVTTVAPELSGAPEVLAELRRRRVLPSIGHCQADWESCEALARIAPEHAITHLGNRMPALQARHGGPMAWALAGRCPWTGVIPDGVHVSPEVLRLFADRLSRRGLLMAQSDNILGAGEDTTRFRAGGKELRRDAPVARDAGGMLAGTVDALPRLLAARVREGTLRWRQAMEMGCHTPGRLLGDCGRLEVGLRADLALLDDDGEVVGSWIGGRPVRRDA